MVWENLALAMALWSGARKGLITKDHLPLGRTLIPTANGKLVQVFNPLELKNEQDLARCINNQVRGAVTFSAMQTSSTLDWVFDYPPLREPDADLRGARCAIYLLNLALSEGLVAPVWTCPEGYRQRFEVHPIDFVLDATSLDGKPVYWEDFGGLEKYLDLLQFCIDRVEDPQGSAGDAGPLEVTTTPEEVPAEVSVTPAEVLTAPEEVLACADQLAMTASESEPVTAFLDAKCVADPGSYTIASELYQEYLAWCQDTGQIPLVQRSFGIQLTKLGFERKRRGRGRHWWKGLQPVNPGAEDEPDGVSR
jgi:hypothetical protein